MRKWIDLFESLDLDDIEGRGAQDRMMRDFSAGAMTPDEFANKWDKGNRRYLYHGTSAKYLESIRERGLQPRAIRGDIEPIWLTPEPETADQYATNEGAILRIPKIAVTGLQDHGNSCSTFEPISPEHIEVEQRDGSWEPLI